MFFGSHVSVVNDFSYKTCAILLRLVAALELPAVAIFYALLDKGSMKANPS
jgi:hypothetical protein